MTKSNYIYALKCPSTGEVRYIGKSCNLPRRYYTHIIESKNKRTYKEKWINSLLINNKLPVLEVLEKISESNWKRYERFYIGFYTLMGNNLTNLTKGGDGFSKGSIPWNKGISTGYAPWNKGTKGLVKPNSGTFKKGMKLSESTLSKMRGRVPWNKGKQMSPETIEKLKKIPFTEERRRKISEARQLQNMDHLKKEVHQYDLNNTFVNKYPSVKEAFQITGINNISACCRKVLKQAGGYIWKYK
jgi:hypothetical protein